MIIKQLTDFLFGANFRLMADDGTGGGGGGGGGASTPPTPPAGGGAPAQPPAPAPITDIRSFIVDEKGTFKEGWAQAAGGDETLGKKFSSLSALVGSYKSLEGMLGREKVPMPTENSTPEEWSAFYNKMGRPEAPDGYGIEKPADLPDTLWDTERTKGFSELAHRIGLTKKQASEIAGWEVGNVKGYVEKSTADANARVEQVAASLKAEWGADYEKRLGDAVRIAEVVGGADLVKDPVLASHPGFIKALSKVADMVGEGKGLPGGRGGAAGGDDAQSEINRILADKNDLYWKGDAKRFQHVQELFAKLHPEEK